MKTQLCLLIAAIVLALFAPGCETFKGKSTPEDAAFSATLVTRTAVGIYLQRHPDSKPAFMKAEDQLTLAIAAEQFNAKTLRKILDAINISELEMENSDEAILRDSLLMLLERYGFQPDLSVPEQAKAVMEGVRDGLRLALGTTGRINSDSRSK